MKQCMSTCADRRVDKDGFHMDERADNEEKCEGVYMS